MPNSADKPAELDQDSSEVIELTEEVDETADGGDPDLDDFGLAMPEFRVPSGGADADARESDEDDAAGEDEDADEEDAENNARSHDFHTEHTATVETDKLARELESDARRDAQPFDRAELVKTVRMDAFDRSAVEAGAPKWDVDGYLEDQRYAPDVLVSPPRVLTKKWQDGPGVRPNGAGPGGPAIASNRAALAATVKTTAPEAGRDEPPSDDTRETEEADAVESSDKAPEGLGRHETEALDIEAEAIEVKDLEGPKPPPKPPKVKEGRPPVNQGVNQPGKQAPGRVRRNTGPLEPPDPTTVPQAEADDDDLSGIVQELLDEKKEKPAAQKKPARDDKRHNWFNDVFSEEYFRTLPRDLEQQTERDVKFIRDSLGLQKGARILDLACGFGRHSVELARRDYEVAGLDISMAMLQRALAEAQQRGLSIKFIHGDMRELNFNGIFDASFCWQTSFGYFDDRTNVRVAKGVARALKPGGRFLVDVVNRDYVVSEMPSRTWWEGYECVFLEEVEFDNHFSVLHTKRSFIYEDGSPPREFSSFIRLYSLHELRQLLHFAGFRVLEVSGEVFHRGSFLGPSSPRLIVMAEKVVKD